MIDRGDLNELVRWGYIDDIFTIRPHLLEGGCTPTLDLKPRPRPVNIYRRHKQDTVTQKKHDDPEKKFIVKNTTNIFIEDQLMQPQSVQIVRQDEDKNNIYMTVTAVNI